MIREGVNGGWTHQIATMDEESPDWCRKNKRLRDNDISENVRANTTYTRHTTTYTDGEKRHPSLERHGHYTLVHVYKERVPEFIRPKERLKAVNILLQL